MPESLRPANQPPSALFREIYAELHDIARRRMSGQPMGHTLQPTALVSEAYLRLCDREEVVQDREHFLYLAARAMRQILVDHARRSAATTRPPRERRVDAAIDGIALGFEARSLGLDALDVALDKLAVVDPDLAQLVELHFFGGQTMEECARILGISQRQVFRRWKAVRAFLHREVSQEIDE